MEEEKVLNIDLENGEETLDLTLSPGNDKLNVFIESVPFQQEIVHRDTTTHWNAQVQLVAERGHIYVYSDYLQVDGVTLPAIKIGDGTTYLIDLPFVSGDNTVLSDHINNIVIHVTAEDKAFWNNKVTCFVSAVDAEHLIFTKESEENYNNG